MCVPVLIKYNKAVRYLDIWIIRDALPFITMNILANLFEYSVPGQETVSLKSMLGNLGAHSLQATKSFSACVNDEKTCIF